jgi:hypothetical protein
LYARLQSVVTLPLPAGGIVGTLLFLFQTLIISFAGAAAAQYSVVQPDFTAKINAFAALIANHALAFVAGHLFRQ